jgi:phosphatidylserine/phosphatidylglycerophosphate/cardiolipin synthase-like enzyme
VADDDRGLVGLVTSANPHDGSSAHENVAIQFRGDAVRDLLEAERAVLKLSDAGHLGVRGAIRENKMFLGNDQPTLQVVSEGKIKEELLAALETAGEGDRIDLVLFYFSDRSVIAALIEARSRGAEVRLLLDPNRDAFGREKDGLPNRQTAHELSQAGILVRWRETHGEQCHSKLMLLRYGDGGTFVSLGSANYTRRNLDDLNLELNVAVRGQRDARVVRDVADYFDALWTNSEGRQFSVEYQRYADPSLLRWICYWTMERSGLCTF